jgi:peptidoglycan hydrolase CwlO-like protein
MVIEIPPMENPQAFARGILENTNNDMSFNESGDVCGNTLGLAFIDRMEAQVRKLSADSAVTTRTIEKLQDEIDSVRKENEKLQDEIDSVRKENEAKIDSVRKEIEAKIDSLEKRVVTLENFWRA